jgi:O-antigen biosynthesis protein
MIDLSIIIVNYNVKEFLLNLLESIRIAAKNISTEIFVVDNASDDGSVESLKEKFPEVKLIVNKINHGFGAANNQALEEAKGKYFLLINPDTIVKKETLVKMIEFFEKNPECGIAGCKVLNPDGTLQLACRRGFPGPWTSFTKVMGLGKLFPKSKLFARYNLTYLDENKTYEVDAVSGAFMMMRREVYEKIGGFDPQFFMYGEDLDLCYRSQKGGYKVFYLHETEIIHYKGESTKRSSIDETKVFYDAMHLFVKKHFSTSFIVESILQAAIIFRKLLAFANVYRLPLISIILDTLFFSLAIILAEKIYLKPPLPDFPSYVIPFVYFVPSIMQILIASMTGSYQKNSLSILRTILALIFGFLFLSALINFLKQFAFSRAVVLIAYSFALFFYVFWRVILKAVFKIGLEADTQKSRTLIVGNENRSEEIALKLKANLTKLYHVVGMIGLSRKNIGEQIGSIRVLGVPENIIKVIKEEKVEKVIFSSEDLSFDQMFSIVSECQGMNVEFLVAGKEMDYLVGKSSITMIDDIHLLKVQYNISSWSYQFTKRLFDLMIGLPTLILVYPFIYLLQKFTSNKGGITHFILKVPQVCMGTKSFVGPRNLSHRDELYVGKVGLTGFWFIENVPDDDHEEMKKLDIFYAKNQTVWLDLEILGKTLSKMFFRTE